MSDLFGRRPFHRVVRETLDELGGHAKHIELVDAVSNRMTKAEYELWAERSFRRAVVAAAKTRSSDLGAEAVYGTGDEVKALRLFSIDEFEAKARQVAAGAKANHDLVYRLRDICADAHNGTTFDAEAILRATGLAS